MDRQYIDDQHVVARYLADQLSEADREAFELYCRENPGMFREIEAAARFKVGLVRLEETKRLQPAIEARSRALPMRRAAMWGGLVVAAGLLYGAVVSLRVPVMGATVAEVSGRLRPPLPSTEAIELFAMRSESILPKKIELPRTPKAILIRVLRDNESADRYRATLRKASGGEI
ncbi:MAG TPA: hypothetical protein VMF52_07750, partial [Steroidobacteraceae bacterium]|nr:hypothetical protein [Steroidobacteraceae bacterium]